MSILKVKSFEKLLANGNAAVVGGRLNGYRAFSTLHRSDDITFAEHEGCLIHDNKVITMNIGKLEKVVMKR